MARRIPTVCKYMRYDTDLWCDPRGCEFASLTDEELDALHTLRVAREGVRKVFGALGQRVIDEQHQNRSNHGSYFVEFANPPGFMSICVWDSAYGERSRASAARALFWKCGSGPRRMNLPRSPRRSS
jgi:hypothetical protein